jgi:hypothetical protein
MIERDAKKKIGYSEKHCINCIYHLGDYYDSTNNTQSICRYFKKMGLEFEVWKYGTCNKFKQR